MSKKQATAAERRHMDRVAQLPCALCGSHGVTMMRIAKLEELDLLANTIEAMSTQ